MNKALLLHNPGAGDEGHSKEYLIKLITQHGFECLYISVKDKEEWKDFDHEFDFIAIAGGDGTVRKVAKKLLNRKLIDKVWPIGLLPLGTANNIAKTLELKEDHEHLIRTWKQKHLQKYDVGRIEGLQDADLFLESLGYGVFPYLMNKMKKREEVAGETPQQKIEAALEMLHEIVLSYEPHDFKLNIDGEDHSGHFVLLEVMNARSFGPNLFLAPEADPADGILEIVAVTEADKMKFANYIAGKLNGKEMSFDFTRYRGRVISMRSEGTHIHVDDEVLKIKERKEIKVELKDGLLQFLTAE